MIPILYEKTETAFTSNGICRLSDIISGTVTEERNGIFIAEFEYPVDGVNYSQIQIGRIIFCSCSQGNKQPFEIYEASRPINGRVIFTARHLTYRGNFVPIAPFTLNNTTPANAMEGMRSHVMSPCTCPFTFESTITSLNNYKQDEPAVLRSRLGGTEGSILDIWGGEYEWGYDFTNQRPLIKLWGNRGANRGVQIKYGKNLTDLQQDESIENMITGVVAFYKNEETCVYSDVVYADVGGQYTTYHRITTLDLTGDYPETIPTKAQLNAKAQSYINSHNIGVPEVNLSISFVNLADTEEYKNIAVLEQVKLCDTVVVEFEKLGVNATAKVIRTVWNILLDKYDSIELGESRTNIATQIIEQDDAIREVKSTTTQLVDVQAAINRATALITGATGGYVVIKQDDNTGYPKEILIMDTPDINTAQKVWRWNENGLGYSSTGYAGTYALAMTKNGEIVASFITSGQMSGERIAANTIDTTKLSVATQTALAQDEQYIYKSKSTVTAEPAYTTWVTDATGNQNTWTTKRPQYSTSYPYCFIAKQKKDAAGVVTCTTPAIDETITQINGGNIVTGTLSAAQIKTGVLADPNNRNSINMSTGAFSLANGAFSYTAGENFVNLANRLSLKLDDIPLAGLNVSPLVILYKTASAINVLRMPYIVYVFIKFNGIDEQTGYEVELAEGLPISNNTPETFGVTANFTTWTRALVFDKDTSLSSGATTGWLKIPSMVSDYNNPFTVAFSYPI